LRLADLRLRRGAFVAEFSSCCCVSDNFAASVAVWESPFFRDFGSLFARFL